MLIPDREEGHHFKLNGHRPGRAGAKETITNESCEPAPADGSGGASSKTRHRTRARPPGAPAAVQIGRGQGTTMMPQADSLTCPIRPEETELAVLRVLMTRDNSRSQPRRVGDTEHKVRAGR